jgi:hypothetical protein
VAHCPRLKSRCVHVERPIFTKMHVGIGPREDVLVGLMILLIQTCGQSVKGRWPIRHGREVRPLEIGVALRLPGGLRNEVIVQRAILIGMPQVEHAAFERLGNLDKEEGLVEGHPDGARLLQHRLLLLRV